MKNSPETLKKRNEKKRMWKKTIDPKSFPHQIKKKCKDCGKIKMCAWQSSFTQTGIPEYKARCIKCHGKYSNMIRRTDKSKRLRNIRRKKLLVKRKQKAIDFLGGKCMRCGYKKSMVALTFHHRNPKEKEFEIGLIKDHTWNKILKELKKCDLLCFNCHMVLHEKLDNKTYENYKKREL